MAVMAVSPSITKTVDVKFFLLDIPETSLLHSSKIKNQLLLASYQPAHIYCHNPQLRLCPILYFMTLQTLNKSHHGNLRYGKNGDMISQQNL
jgi:hypothetical protein